MSWKLAEWRWRQEAGLTSNALSRPNGLDALRRRQGLGFHGQHGLEKSGSDDWDWLAGKKHNNERCLQPLGTDAKFGPEQTLPQGMPRNHPPLSTSRSPPSSYSSFVPLLPASYRSNIVRRDSVGSSAGCKSLSAVERSPRSPENPDHLLPQQPRDFLARSLGSEQQRSDLPDTLKDLRKDSSPFPEIAIEILINQNFLWPGASPSTESKYFNTSIASIDLSDFPEPPRHSNRATSRDGFDRFCHQKPPPRASTQPSFVIGYKIDLVNGTLEVHDALFDLLNPHESLIDRSFVSPEDSRQTCSSDKESQTYEMGDNNSFRDHLIGKRRKGTSHRPIYLSLPEAHSAISGSFKIPSQSAGIEQTQDKTAKRKPFVGLPHAPDRLRPEKASPAVKEPIVSGGQQSGGSNEVTERPLTPLLPPTLLFGDDSFCQSRSPTPPRSSSLGAPNISQEDPRELENIAAESGFGHEDYSTRPIRPVRSHDAGFRGHGRGRSKESEDSVDVIADEPPLSHSYDYANHMAESVGSPIRFGGRRRLVNALDEKHGNALRMTENFPIGIATSSEFDLQQHIQSISPFPRRNRQNPVGKAPEAPLPAVPEESNSYPVGQHESSSAQQTSYGETSDLLNLHVPSRSHVVTSSRGILQPLTHQDYSEHIEAGQAMLESYFRPYSQELPEGAKSTTQKSKGIGGELDEMLARDPVWGDPHIRLVPVANVKVNRTPMASLDLAHPRSYTDEFHDAFNLHDDHDGNQRIIHSLTPPRATQARPECSSNFDDNMSRGEHHLMYLSGRNVSGGVQGCLGYPPEADDGTDWETVHDSGLETQFNTRPSLGHGMTNQSLANVSTSGSLNPNVQPLSYWDPLATDSCAWTQYFESEIDNERRNLEQDTRNLRQPGETEAENEGEVVGRNSKKSFSGSSRFCGNESNLGRPAGDIIRPAPVLTATSKSEHLPKHDCNTAYRHPRPLHPLHLNPFLSSPPGIHSSQALESSSVLGLRLNPYMAGPHELEADGLTAINGDNEAVCKKGQQKPSNFSGDNDRQSASSTYTEEEIRRVRKGKDGVLPEDSDQSSSVSKLSADGSYAGGFYPVDDASIASLIREAEPDLPRHPVDTFTKHTILGPKANITGSIRGTGMRAAGSSTADYSDSPSIKDYYNERCKILSDWEAQRYKELAEAKEIIDEDTAGPSSDGWKLLSMDKGKGRAKPKMIMPALRLQTRTPGWGLPNASTTKLMKSLGMRDNTDITTRDGRMVSMPRLLARRPWTLAPGNTFELNPARGPRPGGAWPDIATVERQIQIREDDWNRIVSECPLFPLQENHPRLMFDYSHYGLPDLPRAKRGRVLPDNSREEQMYCFTHARWEFSHPPGLVARPLTHDERLQRESGQRVVTFCAWVPVIGWVLLWEIMRDTAAGRQLLEAWTGGEVVEFRAEEREMAAHILWWFAVALGGLFLGLVGVTVWAIVH